MTISADDILRVRRMTNEPTEATYTDELIQAMAEEHKLTVTNWPSADTVVYDLHGLASTIWEEKAAALSPEVTSGSSSEFGETSDEFIDMSYKHACEQAEKHFAQRMARSHRPAKRPREAETDVTL